jgi:hypothetical protein
MAQFPIAVKEKHMVTGFKVDDLVTYREAEVEGYLGQASCDCLREFSDIQILPKHCLLPLLQYANLYIKVRRP